MDFDDAFLFEKPYFVGDPLIMFLKLISLFFTIFESQFGTKSIKSGD